MSGKENETDIPIPTSPTNIRPQKPPRLSSVFLGQNSLVLVMVGLPARGKTFIAKRLAHYLSFTHGVSTQVFNVGNYRRELFGSSQSHDFFDPSNEEGDRLRRLCAEEAMKDMKIFLQEGQFQSQVAIYDATNTANSRREWILSELEETGVQVVFIESICEDDEIINQNIRNTKLDMPDYADFDPEAAVADFKLRIQHYETIYDTIEDESLSWIKVIDVGRKVVINRINGFILGKIVQFLMNLHQANRPIYFSRHGESEYNMNGKIGGDSPISSRGNAYAQQLAEFFNEHVLSEHGPIVHVWTSSLQRTIETIQYFPSTYVQHSKQWRALDELYAGICDGMTYEEIERNYPEEFKARLDDKLTYRYPRGESYLDVIMRCDPVINELERLSEPVFIVSHQGVLRIIIGYFMQKKREECPAISIPLHTVIKLIPKAYGCDIQYFKLDESTNHHTDGPPSH